MMEENNLNRLSKLRIAMSRDKYKDSWKKLSRKELVQNIREELADVISYISFCEKNFDEDYEDSKVAVQVLFDKLLVEITAINNKRKGEFVVGNVERTRN
jgi:hypothetical protein